MSYTTAARREHTSAVNILLEIMSTQQKDVDDWANNADLCRYQAPFL